ncbi:imelysin family protein [Acuticoccus sp. MNP-M23]|uniref:imelysin family protein n=1 Tax=Acuticoccus sp. MNP-M23 TaxID=3072793 RepID=UPI0028157A7C|nr:imelysin family protein [Acuticoccus sp. MNP-M23]WMS43037.1 imelysin family protein [Acuticoccus sp. MNP-M23]
MKTAVLAAMVALAVSPALAQEGGGRAFAPAVAGLIETVIVPQYARFTEAAKAEAALVADLCAAPDEARLAAARDGFLASLTAFSQVEMFRFGPAREDNRIDRLFFWPDRRGRGLRQIQGLIAEADETAATAETLKVKSVAVQGLPALEFVLFGTGAKDLLAPGSFRCRYGSAIAATIVDVAGALEADWRGPFAALMEDAGPNNPVYRNHGEALQDILQAAAEQIEMVKDLKLGASIGDSPDDAHPKRIPFWRSGGALPALEGNVAGVDALLAPPLVEVLNADDVWLQSVRFELELVHRTLAALIADGRPFGELATDAEGHRRMAYAAHPLAGAHTILAVRIPGELGFVAGFNAMDGD